MKGTFRIKPQALSCLQSSHLSKDGNLFPLHEQREGMSLQERLNDLQRSIKLSSSSLLNDVIH